MATPPPDGSNPRGDALDPDDASVKAKLDDTELNIGSPRAAQKVELDLDDAPFLEEEEIVPPPAEEIPTAPAPQELEEAPRLPPWKNKKIILGAAGGLLLIVGLAVWWFFLRTKEEPPPPPPEPAHEEPVKPPEPVAAPPPPQDVYVSMAPFTVEKTDAKGVVRILSLKIKLVYKEDPRLARELQAKSFAVRDGLYYNLKNKSFGHLTDKDAVEQLREELRGVVNNYLNSGQVDQVLFEELLVK